MVSLWHEGCGLEMKCQWYKPAQRSSTSEIVNNCTVLETRGKAKLLAWHTRGKVNDWCASDTMHLPLTCTIKWSNYK